MVLRETPVFLFVSAMCTVAWGESCPQPAPVDEYAIHSDGGIVYDPLRREAELTGQLSEYKDVTRSEAVIESGGFSLKAHVPRVAHAYDVVSIPYELEVNRGGKRFPVAVEAVAFEDLKRRGEHCYDMAMPNRVELAIEFAGSITAHLIPGARHNLEPDMSDGPKTYPPFQRSAMQRSGVVEAGDLVWLKLRYTNTGDTILDPEGYGGCLFYPQLLKKDAAGEYVVMGGVYNLYTRDTQYLYPGESHEIWLHCTSNNPPYAEPATPAQNASGTPQGFGMAPGDYLLRMRVMMRRYSGPEPFLNIWEGAQVFIWECPFSVEPEPRQTPVSPGRATFVDETDKRTGFIHTFEEFMTAFDCHLAPPQSGEETVKGTLHLQVAPWTEHVVVKLIAGNPVEGASVAVPIRVKSDKLAVRFNPHHQGVVIRDGMSYPVIASQAMADMRTNVQIGPFPENHIRERMREMMDCGINVLATTSMPWLYADFRKPAGNYQGDAFKYVLEVARDEGMRIQGWGTYPYDRSPVKSIAEAVSGTPLDIKHYTLGKSAISHAEPELPRANAIVWLYQFHRWGDLYHQDGRGVVPIGVEDSRGWMRQDVNVRHQMGGATVEAFREWLRRRYGTIDAVNQAWETKFASWTAIDPEKNQIRNRFGHFWEYTDKANPFHDWNPAVCDLDRFRTELRVRNYRDTLELVRREIPNASVCLRTEGANVLVAGIDPADPNSHLRHIYYSQRRCAAIAEILRESDTLAYHSDYTTMPYTPTELRRLTRMAVEQGIVPSYLPQFCNMRDIAVNAKYGTEYQTHYNLPEPRKGYMMHALAPLFPWFKATYEEGGVPGILWEDYQCDGFATETQKREMRIFKRELEKTLNSPEARQQRQRADPPDDTWRKGTRGLRSYE